MRKASSALRRRSSKPDHSRTWLKKLVNRAEKDPSVLKRASREDPELCAALCERVTHLALVESPAVLPLALATFEIAEGLEDPHLRNRAREALIHAYSAAGERDQALKLIRESAEAASYCCELCRAAFFSRIADIANRSGHLAEGFQSLTIALDQNQKASNSSRDWSEEAFDNWGRILHVQAVNWARLGLRPLALTFARVAFTAISLDSPRGLFLELLALVADVLRGGSADDDQLALECVESFRSDLKGTRMTDVLARTSHVEGLVRARLGGKRNFRIARERLEGATVKLRRHGTPLDALAGALDAAQFRCRPHPNAKEGEAFFPTATNLRTAKRWLQRCGDRSDLGEHKEALDDLVGVLEDQPETAFAAIGSYREKLGAPVAALLGERIGPPPEENEEPVRVEVTEGEASADGLEIAPVERASTVSWSLPASGFSRRFRYLMGSGDESGVVVSEDE